MNGGRMNGSKPPVRYGRKRGRGNKVRLSIVITAAAVIAGVILFLIVGNSLNSKVTGGNSGTRRTTTTSDARPHVPSIKAYPVTPGGAVADEIAAAAGFGADSISFSVKDGSGNAVYSSEILRKLGRQSDSGSKTELDDLVSAARGKYISAFLVVSAFSETDEGLRSVLLAIDAALACEVVAGGADDVVICAPNIVADNYKEIIRLAEQIKNINPDATVGFAIGSGLRDAENSAVIVDELRGAFDFLALDLTGAPDAAAVSAGADKLLYDILRYDMRILLPKSDAGTLNAMIAVLSSSGIENWQVI